MNEKTYHISQKQLAEAEALTARIYPESVLKAVWRRIRKPSRKTILKLLPAPDFAVLRAAELTLSHGYRYFGIINEAAGYAITNANSSAIGDMAFGNGHTTYVPGLSIPIKPESELLIHCLNEQPARGFALDAKFISHSMRTKSRPENFLTSNDTNGAERAERNNLYAKTRRRKSCS
jgi:hypothetical protein